MKKLLEKLVKRNNRLQLNVYKSKLYYYVQIIDKLFNKTIISCFTIKKKYRYIIKFFFSKCLVMGIFYLYFTKNSVYKGKIILIINYLRKRGINI